MELFFLLYKWTQLFTNLPLTDLEVMSVTIFLKQYTFQNQMLVENSGVAPLLRLFFIYILLLWIVCGFTNFQSKIQACDFKPLFSN